MARFQVRIPVRLAVPSGRALDVAGIARLFSLAFQTFFADPETYPLDDRAVTHSMAFFSPKHSNTGSFYLMTIRDKAGDAFDGASTLSP